MPPIFAHRSPAPLTTRNYRLFRLYIREDFQECCAYCFLHERFAGGERNFELDHFRPRSLFEHLAHEYNNIYYACHICNLTKHDSWPSDALQAKGYRFVDACAENFSFHFRDGNGHWQPMSRAGEYSAERLRLNTEHLVQVRRLLYRLLEHNGKPPIDWDQPLTPQLAPILRLLSQESLELEQP